MDPQRLALAVDGERRPVADVGVPVPEGEVGELRSEISQRPLEGDLDRVIEPVPTAKKKIYLEESDNG